MFRNISADANHKETSNQSKLYAMQSMFYKLSIVLSIQYSHPQADIVSKSQYIYIDDVTISLVHWTKCLRKFMDSTQN